MHGEVGASYGVSMNAPESGLQVEGGAIAHNGDGLLLREGRAAPDGLVIMAHGNTCRHGSFPEWHRRERQLDSGQVAIGSADSGVDNCWRIENTNDRIQCCCGVMTVRWARKGCDSCGVTALGGWGVLVTCVTPLDASSV